MRKNRKLETRLKARYFTEQRRKLLSYLSEHTDVFYQYIASDKCKDNLHLSCRICGKSLHLGEQEANQLIQRTLESTGFQIDKNETVLYGICATCRKIKDTKKNG